MLYHDNYGLLLWWENPLLPPEHKTNGALGFKEQPDDINVTRCQYEQNNKR